MRSFKKVILITMFIFFFLFSIVLIPCIIFDSRNGDLGIGPGTLASNKEYPDHTINENQGPYTYGSEDSFIYDLEISASAGNSITVTFSGSTFNVDDLLISGEGTATVIFTGCTIQVYTLSISGNADVTFEGCQIQVTSTEVHTFMFEGDSKVTICDSVVSDSVVATSAPLFEIVEDSQCYIYGTTLDMATTAIRVFDSSVVHIEANSGETGARSEVTASLIYMAWQRDPEGIASLTISDSDIHCPILNIQTRDVFSAVTIQGSSTVDFIVDTLWVTESDPLDPIVTIIDNEVSPNSQNYEIWSPVVDPTSTVQEEQFAVIGFKDAQVSIKSSDIFAVMTAGASEITICTSIIHDVIGGADHGRLNIKDTTIRGAALGKVPGYGPISLGSYFQHFSTRWFSETYDLQKPVISLTRCTVVGNIFAWGDHTVIFQDCTYTREIEHPGIAFATQNFLAIHMDSETDVFVSGYSIGARVYRAELIINGYSYGSVDHTNFYMHFTLDPSLSTPYSANFEVVATYGPSDTFTRQFTIDIVDDDADPPVIDIQYEGSYTIDDRGRWDVRVSDENEVDIEVTIDGDPVIPDWNRNYMGRYSFTDDEDGSPPEGWVYSVHGSTNVQVVPFHNGHSKVLELRDSDPLQCLTIANQISPKRVSGVVEFWICGVEGTADADVLEIVLFAAVPQIGLLAAVWLHADWDSAVQTLEAWDSVTQTYVPTGNLISNEWHHIRIQFDCSSGGTYDVWFDGYRYGPFGFRQEAPYVSSIHITSVGATSDFYAYFDAVDYSWAPGYELNRNMDVILQDEFDVPAGTGVPEIHEITVYAIDQDNDRDGDQLDNEVSHTVPIGVPSLALTVFPASCDYEDWITFDAQLLVSGSPASGEDVHFYLDLNGDAIFGEEDEDLGTIETDQTGVASLDWKCALSPGDYEVRAEIDLPTLSLNAAESFTITKEDDLQLSLSITNPNLEIFGRWTVVLQATLLEDGKPLAGKTIHFTGWHPFLGNHITGSVTTDPNGIASFTTPPRFYFWLIGTTYFASFNGDCCYSSVYSPKILLGDAITLLMATPDLDLHVFDSEGRHVGVNYTSNEVEIGIPGAFYSGDLINGTEWIILPPNVTDYYVVVDARDAHFPTEEYQLNITTWTPDNETLQTSQNETIQAGEIDAWVPQVDPETGELIVPSVEESITEKLELLIATIIQLEDSVFDKNPSQRKNALRDKILEVAFEDYSSAYDKVLHDIKPKLTGLKTDENEVSWGTGVFKKPWVIDSDAQEVLRKQCNVLLYEINLII